MTIVYGLGIENETSFNFTDLNRVERNSKLSESPPTKITPNDNSWWNPQDKWNNSRSSRNYFQIHGDPTVDGNYMGSGFEFQINNSKSLNQNSKDMVMKLFQAEGDAARLVKSRLPYVTPNPFASSIGFDTNESDGKFGSFHINVTMPYDDEKISNSEYLNDYRKKLFKGIKVIRAIEPLFLAMIGGADLSSVGNWFRGEGSPRHAYLSYCNIGNVKLDDKFRNFLFENSFTGSIRQYKYGNTTPSFKSILRKTIPGESGRNKITEGQGVGDIILKQYRNVDSKIRTVEFRFLDPFFVPNVYEILKVMVSAMEHGKNVGDIHDSRESSEWNKATASIIEEGWNARLPKEYQQMLKDKLELDISIKDNKRADLVFQEVALALWNKNKNGFWVKTMIDDSEPPKVLNLNRYNWDMQFRHKYENQQEFESYINKFIATLSKIDASKSDGWIKVDFNSNGKVVIRDLILDDSNFGKDMAIEDYEDILFLLERIQAVELKKDEAGLIQELKVLYTDPKEVMKKLDNLQTIEGVEETYFGRQVEEVTQEARIQDREYQSGTRIRVSATGSNIDTSLLTITRVSPQPETALDYNTRDFQVIFDSSNFTDESNQQFNISVIPAKIIYDGHQLMSFWERSGRTVKVYINAESFDVEDEPSVLVGRMKSNFYSNISVTRSNVFTLNLSVEEFFARLLLTTQNTYSKLHHRIEKITLDKAGLETLKGYGLRIASISRGKNYILVNKRKYNSFRIRYGSKLKLIKYMPYKKGVYVQKEGKVFTLFQYKNKIDKIMEED